MSSWTVLTVRGREGCDYEFTREDTSDRWVATADIVATMDEDGRVRRWTTWSGHVYAYLLCDGFASAERVLADYSAMVDDAVVLVANDTTDTGATRYYSRPNLGRWTDHYEETQRAGEYYVGELALAVINARHGIVARDPFHNRNGQLDEEYLEKGKSWASREGDAIPCRERDRP